MLSKQLAALVSTDNIISILTCLEQEETLVVGFGDKCSGCCVITASPHVYVREYLVAFLW